MRSLIAFLLLLLASNVARAQCSFSNPTACGSPGVNNLAVGGNQTVGGTFSATGNATFGGTLSMVGAITIGTGTSNTATLTGGASSSSPVIMTFGNTSTGLELGSAGTQPLTAGQIKLGQNSNYSSSGSTLNPVFAETAACTGSYTTAGFGGCNQMINGNDTLAYSGQGFAELYVSETAGSGATGDRIGINAILGIPVQVTGGNQQHTVMQATGTISANQGGSNPTSGQSAGSLFGLNPNVALKNGATSISGLIGQENDCAIATGASAQQKTCFQIIQTSIDAVQGNDEDIAFMIGNQNGPSNPGWVNLISIGSIGSAWPVSPSNGVLFAAQPQASQYVAAGVTQQLPAAAGLGGVWLDLMDVATASGFSFRGAGFATDGTGQIYSANAKLATNSTGMQLDLPNQIVTAVSVNTAGGGLNDPVYPGDEMYGITTNAYRGIYKATHVQAVTGSTVGAGGSGGTPGTQTVTLSGGTCGTPPQFSVTVSAGGAITSVNSVSTAGDCTVVPSNTNRGWAVTGASLSGATLNVALGAKTVTIVTPDAGASQPATLTLSDDGGSRTRGVILNLTWSARQVLTLNPSGDTVVGLGTQLGSLNATKGFLHLPYTNATSGSGGIPTGTPANTAGPACVWNDVTFNMDCFSPSAGAWKHVAFSAGAG